MKLAYIVGVLYLVFCGSLIALRFTEANNTGISSLLAAASPEEWFSQIKPYCNPVEVTAMTTQHPAPSSAGGQAYTGACFALAGDIIRARSILQALPKDDQQMGIKTMLEVAHTAADAGDGKSAFPIMKLVLEFSPDNPIALYHAGMAELDMDNYDAANAYLVRFLQLYPTDDALRRNAQRVVERLE